ncbi:recombinase family protein [Krasilnikovia sp. MM14-A1259]|uniref:recombinase family protein n=1 Tax=Krasilnikovia sp. MM14-A1259 TaxID=3373539 RepID=UPI00399C8D6A
MRAAIYCRISRDRVGAGLGVQRQEEDCRELVERQGWDVAGIYTDNDLSAYRGKPRPGYRELLKAMTAGAVDVVVAWHTDRLHRSPVELEKYITTSEQRGIATHTVKAGPLDLSTPSGRLVARQLGAVARYEVEHAIERQQRSKRQAATAGRWKGGRRPYGYEPDGVTVRPAEAEVVRRATDAVLAGDSLRSIASALNEQGLTTSTGGPWLPTELKKVLVRPRNAGLMEHQREIIGKANWEPIVDENRWRAVVAMLGDPGRRTTTTSERRWLLSGLARCGVCGGPVLCTQNGRSSIPSYTCKMSKHVIRIASELDAFVGALVVARLARPDAIELLTVAEPDETASALRDATALRERLDGLAVAYAGGVIDARQLAAGSDRLRAELESVEAKLAVTGNASAFADLGLGTPDVEARWKALTLARKRAVTEALLDITINRARRGRRPGWRPGESYFDASTIGIAWRA